MMLIALALPFICMNGAVSDTDVDAMSTGTYDEIYFTNCTGDFNFETRRIIRCNHVEIVSSHFTFGKQFPELHETHEFHHSPSIAFMPQSVDATSSIVFTGNTILNWPCGDGVVIGGPFGTSRIGGTEVLHGRCPLVKDMQTRRAATAGILVQPTFTESSWIYNLGVPSGTFYPDRADSVAETYTGLDSTDLPFEPDVYIYDNTVKRMGAPGYTYQTILLNGTFVDVLVVDNFTEPSMQRVSRMNEEYIDPISALDVYMAAVRVVDSPDAAPYNLHIWNNSAEDVQTGILLQFTHQITLERLAADSYARYAVEFNAAFPLVAADAIAFMGSVPLTPMQQANHIQLMLMIIDFAGGRRCGSTRGVYLQRKITRGHYDVSCTLGSCGETIHSFGLHFMPTSSLHEVPVRRYVPSTDAALYCVSPREITYTPELWDVCHAGEKDSSGAPIYIEQMTNPFLPGYDTVTVPSAGTGPWTPWFIRSFPRLQEALQALVHLRNEPGTPHVPFCDYVLVSAPEFEDEISLTYNAASAEYAGICDRTLLSCYDSEFKVPYDYDVSLTSRNLPYVWQNVDKGLVSINNGVNQTYTQWMQTHTYVVRPSPLLKAKPWTLYSTGNRLSGMAVRFEDVPIVHRAQETMFLDGMSSILIVRGRGVDGLQPPSKHKFTLDSLLPHRLFSGTYADVIIMNTTVSNYGPMSTPLIGVNMVTMTEEDTVALYRDRLARYEQQLIFNVSAPFTEDGRLRLPLVRSIYVSGLHIENVVFTDVYAPIFATNKEHYVVTGNVDNNTYTGGILPVLWTSGDYKWASVDNWNTETGNITQYLFEGGEFAVAEIPWASDSIDTLYYPVRPMSIIASNVMKMHALSDLAVKDTVCISLQLDPQQSYHSVIVADNVCEGADIGIQVALHVALTTGIGADLEWTQSRLGAYFSTTGYANPYYLSDLYSASRPGHAYDVTRGSVLYASLHAAATQALVNVSQTQFRAIIGSRDFENRNYPLLLLPNWDRMYAVLPNTTVYVSDETLGPIERDTAIEHIARFRTSASEIVVQPTSCMNSNDTCFIYYGDEVYTPETTTTYDVEADAVLVYGKGSLLDMDLSTHVIKVDGPFQFRMQFMNMELGRYVDNDETSSSTVHCIWTAPLLSADYEDNTEDYGVSTSARFGASVMHSNDFRLSSTRVEVPWMHEPWSLYGAFGIFLTNSITIHNSIASILTHPTKPTLGFGVFSDDLFPRYTIRITDSMGLARIVNETTWSGGAVPYNVQYRAFYIGPNSHSSTLDIVNNVVHYDQALLAGPAPVIRNGFLFDRLSADSMLNANGGCKDRSIQGCTYEDQTARYFQMRYLVLPNLPAFSTGPVGYVRGTDHKTYAPLNVPESPTFFEYIPFDDSTAELELVSCDNRCYLFPSNDSVCRVDTDAVPVAGLVFNELDDALEHCQYIVANDSMATLFVVYRELRQYSALGSLVDSRYIEIRGVDPQNAISYARRPLISLSDCFFTQSDGLYIVNLRIQSSYAGNGAVMFSIPDGIFYSYRNEFEGGGSSVGIDGVAEDAFIVSNTFNGFDDAIRLSGLPTITTSTGTKLVLTEATATTTHRVVSDLKIIQWNSDMAANYSDAFTHFFPTMVYTRSPIVCNGLLRALPGSNDALCVSYSDFNWNGINSVIMSTTQSCPVGYVPVMTDTFYGNSEWLPLGSKAFDTPYTGYGPDDYNTDEWRIVVATAPPTNYVRYSNSGEFMCKSRSDYWVSDWENGSLPTWVASGDPRFIFPLHDVELVGTAWANANPRALVDPYTPGIRFATTPFDMQMPNTLQSIHISNGLNMFAEGLPYDAMMIDSRPFGIAGLEAPPFASSLNYLRREIGRSHIATVAIEAVVATNSSVACSGHYAGRTQTSWTPNIGPVTYGPPIDVCWQTEDYDATHWDQYISNVAVRAICLDDETKLLIRYDNGTEAEDSDFNGPARPPYSASVFICVAKLSRTTGAASYDTDGPSEHIRRIRGLTTLAARKIQPGYSSNEVALGCDSTPIANLSTTTRMLDPVGASGELLPNSAIDLAGRIVLCTQYVQQEEYDLSQMSFIVDVRGYYATSSALPTLPIIPASSGVWSWVGYNAAFGNPPSPVNFNEGQGLASYVRVAVRKMTYAQILADPLAPEPVQELRIIQGTRCPSAWQTVARIVEESPGQFYYYPFRVNDGFPIQNPPAAVICMRFGFTQQLVQERSIDFSSFTPGEVITGANADTTLTVLNNTFIDIKNSAVRACGYHQQSISNNTFTKVGCTNFNDPDTMQPGENIIAQHSSAIYLCGGQCPGAILRGTPYTLYGCAENWRPECLPVESTVFNQTVQFVGYYPSNANWGGLQPIIDTVGDKNILRADTNIATGTRSETKTADNPLLLFSTCAFLNTRSTVLDIAQFGEFPQFTNIVAIDENIATSYPVAIYGGNIVPSGLNISLTDASNSLSLANVHSSSINENIRIATGTMGTFRCGSSLTWPGGMFGPPLATVDLMVPIEDEVITCDKLCVELIDKCVVVKNQVLFDVIFPVGSQFRRQNTYRSIQAALDNCPEDVHMISVLSAVNEGYSEKMVDTRPSVTIKGIRRDELDEVFPGMTTAAIDSIRELVAEVPWSIGCGHLLEGRWVSMEDFNVALVSTLDMLNDTNTEVPTSRIRYGGAFPGADAGYVACDSALWRGSAPYEEKTVQYRNVFVEGAMGQNPIVDLGTIKTLVLWNVHTKNWRRMILDGPLTAGYAVYMYESLFENVEGTAMHLGQSNDLVISKCEFRNVGGNIDGDWGSLIAGTPSSSFVSHASQFAIEDVEFIQSSASVSMTTSGVDRCLIAHLVIDYVSPNVGSIRINRIRTSGQAIGVRIVYPSTLDLMVASPDMDMGSKDVLSVVAARSYMQGWAEANDYLIEGRFGIVVGDCIKDLTTSMLFYTNGMTLKFPEFCMVMPYISQYNPLFGTIFFNTIQGAIDNCMANYSAVVIVAPAGYVFYETLSASDLDYPIHITSNILGLPEAPALDVYTVDYLQTRPIPTIESTGEHTFTNLTLLDISYVTVHGSSTPFNLVDCTDVAIHMNTFTSDDDDAPDFEIDVSSGVCDSGAVIQWTASDVKARRIRVMDNVLDVPSNKTLISISNANELLDATLVDIHNNTFERQRGIAVCTQGIHATHIDNNKIWGRGPGLTTGCGGMISVLSSEPGLDTFTPPTGAPALSPWLPAVRTLSLIDDDFDLSRTVLADVYVSNAYRYRITATGNSVNVFYSEGHGVGVPPLLGLQFETPYPRPVEADTQHVTWNMELMRTNPEVSATHDRFSIQSCLRALDADSSPGRGVLPLLGIVLVVLAFMILTGSLFWCSGNGKTSGIVTGVILLLLTLILWVFNVLSGTRLLCAATLSAFMLGSSIPRYSNYTKLVRAGYIVPKRLRA